jgi:hypothetical protein
MSLHKPTAPPRLAGLRPDELAPGQNSDDHDTLAAGTAGGGLAAGGLGGTNLGDGSPDDETDLENAFGSGIYDDVDRADERGRVGGEEPQSGRAGGAVGGTPAGKRVKPRQK